MNKQKFITFFTLLTLFISLNSIPVNSLTSVTLPKSDYSGEQGFFSNHSIPRDTLDKRTVKVAILTDGLVAENQNIDYSAVKKLYDAASGKEFKLTPSLDWEYTKKYPGSVGTFVSGILISKPTADKDLSTLLNNAQLEIINVFDGLGTTDKIYSLALAEANSWGADLVINASALYDTFNSDKATQSCLELSSLTKKGVAVVSPASTDGEKNIFSLSDCPQSINIGYLSKELTPNTKAISRDYRLVTIGQDVLSFINSGSEYPFTYSSSNQWSAVIAGGIIAKLFSNSDLTTFDISKNLLLSSIELDQNTLLLNYSKALAYINSKPAPLIDKDYIQNSISSVDTGRVSGIVTNDKGFEVSIRPARLSTQELRYTIYYYKKDDKNILTLIEKRELAKGSVRALFTENFSSGSFIILESKNQDNVSKFSIPYDDSTFVATPLPSDPRAKVTSLSAKWGDEGLIINSTSDSKLGNSEPRNIVVVDNLEWNVLFTQITTGDRYLLRLTLDSPLRWQELGVGVSINGSEERIAVQPYYNTKFNLSKTGKDKYLIKGKVELRYCDSSCVKKGIDILVNGKVYKSKILPSSGEFYLYLTSKAKIRKVGVKSTLLKAQDLIIYS